MSHLYCCEEWQSGCSNKWYVNDVKELATTASKWWMAMRVLNMTVEEYIDFLMKYKAKGISYSLEYDVLHFYFETQTDARKYKNYVNKKARERNFICGQ